MKVAASGPNVSYRGTDTLENMLQDSSVTAHYVCACVCVCTCVCMCVCACVCMYYVRDRKAFIGLLGTKNKMGTLQRFEPQHSSVHRFQQMLLVQ